MRQVVIHNQAFADMHTWSRDDRKILAKIIELIEATRKEPFAGIGKPEPLKYEFRNCWSRRITQEHRLVYQVTDEEIIIISCKEHYK